MKKALLLLLALLLISTSALALQPCKQNHYFTYDGGKFYGTVDNITRAFGGSHREENRVDTIIYTHLGNECAMGVTGQFDVYARYPAGQVGVFKIAETKLLKIKMTAYHEDKLGGTGNNDVWDFEATLYSPNGSAVSTVKKEIREWGGKMTGVDAEISISLPSDGSEAFYVQLVLDSDSYFSGKGVTGGGAQVDKLTVVAKQDITALMAKLANLRASVPDSKELADRKKKLAELKESYSVISDSNPEKADLKEKIDAIEANLQEKKLQEEIAAENKRISDAEALAQELLGGTTPSVRPPVVVTTTDNEVKVDFSEWVQPLKDKGVSNPIEAINDKLRVIQVDTSSIVRVIAHETLGEQFIILKDVVVGKRYKLTISPISVGGAKTKEQVGTSEPVQEKHLITAGS